MVKQEFKLKERTMIMSKILKKLALPLVGLGMLTMMSGNAYGAIGDTVVAVDALGRSWYDPFSGLTGASMTFTAQKSAIEALGFIAANMGEVAAMYCFAFGGGTGPPCSATTDSDSDLILDFQEYATAFGFGTGSSFSGARTTTGGSGSHFITGYSALGVPLMLNAVSGTFDASQPDGNTIFGLGFMYYATVDAPTTLSMLGVSLLGMGYMVSRRKKA